MPKHQRLAKRQMKKAAANSDNVQVGEPARPNNKVWRQAAPPKIPIINWSLAIGNNARAEGEWSLALGNDVIAVAGATCIGSQLYYDDGELDDMPPEHKQAWLNMFRSPEMQLWAVRRREHYTAEQYSRMVKWINRFMGETVFEEIKTAKKTESAAADEPSAGDK